MQEGKYNIKAVSKLLGIQSGTLRAWERRYKFIAPERNESGHRLYSDHHVQILKWLVTKTEQGFTISQAVALLEPNELFPNQKEEPIEAVSPAKEMADELLQALLHFDEDKAHTMINQAFSIYTIEKAVIDILGSILVQIGHMWESGEITSAHEHFASAIIKSRISFIMHTLPSNNMLPKIISVCGPGEAHEFGLLIFTLYLKRKGFQTIYLGPSVDEKDLITVLDIIKPKSLFFSCTMLDALDRTLAAIDDIHSRYPELIIGLGGFAIDEAQKEVKERYKENLVGTSQKDWNNWLATRLN